MTNQKWEKVSHDPRDLHREMQEGHGGHLVNMIVGLVINSNDAYERLDFKGIRRISIEVDRTKRESARGIHGKALVRVKDWAAGMDYEDFGNFNSYGGDKSRWTPGAKIAGLFGREASDVMWSNVKSKYVAVKDGHGYTCEFRAPSDYQRSQLSRRDTKRIQNVHEIRAGNFTMAEFYLNQDYRLPHHPQLIAGLIGHFRLRLINVDPSVEITLAYRDSYGPKKPQRVSILRLEDDEAGAELLSEKMIQFNYKDYPPVTGEARLYRKNDRELKQGGIDRENGILVFADDDTVLDLSLFGFEESAYARDTARIFGYVRLELAGILRKELRDAEQRRALIEVDRSQLSHRSDFYKVLKACLDDWIRPWVDRERVRTARTRVEDSTRNWNRRLRPLLAEINRVVNQKTGQPGPQVGGIKSPPDTLRFARDKISTSVGTIYRLELFINTSVVPAGNTVLISSDNPVISVDPVQASIPHPNYPALPIVSRIVVRLMAGRVDEEATVTATSLPYGTAYTKVKSIEPDIYFPHDGVGWWPNTFEAVSGRISRPTLWVDLTKVAEHEIIRISTPGGVASIDDKTIAVSAVDIVKDDLISGLRIGKVRPRFRADGAGTRGTLLAQWRDVVDELDFIVVDPRSPRIPGTWTFSGIEWEEGIPEMDVYPDPEGKICLNVAHPLIASYFGSSATEAVQAVSENAGLRVLAAHLVVDCLLNDISRKAWRNVDGPAANLEIGARTPNQMDWQVYHYVMKLKAEYGSGWVKKITEVLED